MYFEETSHFCIAILLNNRNAQTLWVIVEIESCGYQGKVPLRKLNLNSYLQTLMTSVFQLVSNTSSPKEFLL